METKLTKLKDNFSRLSAIDIVKKIASYKISGLWLTEENHKKAKEICDKISEKEAIEVLNNFDKERQSGYNLWRAYC